MNHHARTVTTRTVQATVSRMIGQSHAEILGGLVSGRIGNLKASQALAVRTSDGDIQALWDHGGLTFDETQPPVGFSWWVPDVDEAPPSVLRGQTSDNPPTLDLLPQGTDGGGGTGKLMSVWDARAFVMRQAGKLLAKVEQKLDGVPGYKGFVAKHIARKVIGRAAGVAFATLYSNVLTKDRRKRGRHYISTRRWKDAQWVGRHCGFAAYYRHRGRPALPEWMARQRLLARNRAKNKGGKSRNKGNGPKVYQTKYPRPTLREWRDFQRNPIEGQAKVLNHRAGRTWMDGWIDFVQDSLDKEPNEIAQDAGAEAAKLIKQEAIDPFFRWVRQGARNALPAASNGTLNTPAVR